MQLSQVSCNASDGSPVTSYHQIYSCWGTVDNQHFLAWQCFLEKLQRHSELGFDFPFLGPVGGSLLKGRKTCLIANNMLELVDERWSTGARELIEQCQTEDCQGPWAINVKEDIEMTHQICGWHEIGRKSICSQVIGPRKTLTGSRNGPNSQMIWLDREIS